MGRLVEINGDPTNSERKAQERLAKILPSNWLVTTNIDEIHFRFNPRELDCLLICPLGIFVIDFKNHRGQITPLLNDPWLGLTYGNSKKENPFGQGRKAYSTVKNHLEARNSNVQWWVEWLVVLTNPDARLDWVGSDCKEDHQQVRVCLLDDVQKHVELFAQTFRSRRLDAQRARLVLETFKARDLSSHVTFIADNWPAPVSKSNRAQSPHGEPSPRPHTASGGSADPGKDDRSIESELGRMFSSRPAARGSAPEIIAEARAIPQSAQAISPQHGAEKREPSSGALNPLVGYSLGLVISVCVALYAIFRLTQCDGACESRRTARAQRERTARALSEQARAQALQPAQDQLRLYYMKQQNISPNCPGQAIEAHETEQWRIFNPNHCAVMWQVLEGRLVIEGVDPSLHWELWPDGPDPNIEGAWKVRSKRGVSKWRYIFCEDYDKLKKAVSEGRSRCS